MVEFDPRIALHVLPADFDGAVVAVVVDQQQLEVCPRLSENALQALFEILLGVVYRCDDRD